MTIQAVSPELAADRRADAALLGAAAVGSVAALVRLTTENALTPVAAQWIWAVLPAFLFLLAHLLTAPAEGRAGIRRQRGALAALTGMAVLSAPLFIGAAFNPVYGIALILLALRTRYTPTAALGALALFAALLVGFLPAPQSVIALALLAVAGGANAVRTWREACGSSL